LNPVVLENRLDRVAADVVTKPFELTANARVAPTRVHACQRNDQCGKVRLGPRATRASRGRAVVLLRDQRAIPPQNRVRSDDAGDARQPPPAERLTLDRQNAALVVGETDSSMSVRGAQDSVLLQQVVDDGL